MSFLQKLSVLAFNMTHFDPYIIAILAAIVGVVMSVVWWSKQLSDTGEQQAHTRHRATEQQLQQ